MSYTSLQYHIVFSTKNNRTFLDEKLLPRLCQYLGGFIRELDGQLLAANGPEDHIHIAVIITPKIAIMDFVRDIKANTSRWIHQTFDNLQDFAWQDGYSAFTVSQSGMKQVTQYICNQNEHHKRMTFREEIIALYKRHNIKYDENYIVA